MFQASLKCDPRRTSAPALVHSASRPLYGNVRKVLWTRFCEVVSRMVDRLNEPTSSFHVSLITNFFDPVEILPGLNVDGNAELNRSRGTRGSSSADIWTRESTPGNWEHI